MLLTVLEERQQHPHPLHEERYVEGESGDGADGEAYVSMMENVGLGGNRNGNGKER